MSKLTYEEANELLGGHFNWYMYNAFGLKEEDGIAIITTPFLDSHNDFFEIVVSRQKDGSYILSDDGYLLKDLEASGHYPQIAIDDGLDFEIRSLGCKIKDGEIFIVIKNDDSKGDLGFNLALFNMCQALMTMSNLIIGFNKGLIAENSI